MQFVTEVLKRISRRAGFSLHRWPPNRFQAMHAGLEHLRDMGFTPTVVIDAGANVGDWMKEALGVFPDAEFHLIEPHPDNTEAVRSLQSIPKVQVHTVALTKPGVASVRMLGCESGQYVSDTDDGTPVPATTLDDLFREKLSGRVLLKLDLEHHEPIALLGAGATLQRVEVIISEVTFFSQDRNVVPFARYLKIVEDHGFSAFDIISLSGRPRDNRLRMGDVVFVRNDSPLVADNTIDP